MKVMYLPVKIEVAAGEFEEVTKRYEITALPADWFDLSCDGEHIAKLISEKECRRVIWSYWTNLGMDLDYLTEDDFNEVDDAL